MHKYYLRKYPKAILNNALARLETISRNDVLTPKKPLLKTILAIHNPEIWLKYDLDVSINNNINSNVYFVMPFYNTISNYREIILETIVKEIDKCTALEYIPHTKSLCLTISYSKANALSDFTK